MCACTWPFSNVLERREQLAQGGDPLVACVLGGEARRHALQGRPDRDHLQYFLLGLFGDVNAAPRDDGDQAFLLQACNGFADRGPADAQLLGELPFVQLEFGRLVVDVHRGDGLLQHVVDVILEAEGAFDGCDLQLCLHLARLDSVRKYGTLTPDRALKEHGTRNICLWYTIDQPRGSRNAKVARGGAANLMAVACWRTRPGRSWPAAVR
jgi:hypothetical protein